MLFNLNKEIVNIPLQTSNSCFNKIHHSIRFKNIYTNILTSRSVILSPIAFAENVKSKPSVEIPNYLWFFFDVIRHIILFSVGQSQNLNSTADGYVIQKIVLILYRENLMPNLDEARKTLNKQDEGARIELDNWIKTMKK